MSSSASRLRYLLVFDLSIAKESSSELERAIALAKVQAYRETLANLRISSDYAFKNDGIYNVEGIPETWLEYAKELLGDDFDSLMGIGEQEPEMFTVTINDEGVQGMPAPSTPTGL
jgi:hypothetical protein